MTKDEFVEKIGIIEARNKLEKNRVRREYALHHNDVYAGDIVEDHIGSVLVEKIEIYMTDNPTCVYYGFELKKNGDKYKKLTKRHVYQTNMVRHEN